MKRLLKMKVLKLTTINEELIRQNHIVDSFFTIIRY